MLIKQRIVFLSTTHKSPTCTITKILHKEGIKASRRGVLKFIKRYRRSGTIHRLPGSGRISKITEEIKAIVEEQMREDDETTAIQLHKLLNDKGYAISRRTVLRCRMDVSWQLILPADQRSKQRQEAPFCAAEPWKNI